MRQLHPTIDKISSNISEELEIDKDIVIEVILSEFSFLADKIREYNVTHEDKPILMNYLGKFTVRPNRRRYLEQYKKVDRE